MANLTEADNWPDGVYQIEEDDPVLGGPSGITNVPPTQLASRTRYQRIFNVTRWEPTLTYPAQAYVQHSGVTWVSLDESTNVAPGSDAIKWVRWGHTAGDIEAQIEGSIDAHTAALDPHPLYAYRSSFSTVPSAFVGSVITVSTPHLRQMVWNGAAYVRAPWHQPGMVLYSYDNPATIPGHLPVRADVNYSQANYPDLSTRLGLSGSGTFTLVELRGEFIRVLDNGRNVDAGRTLRSAQAGANAPHTHPLNDPKHGHVVNETPHGHTGNTSGAGAHNHGAAKVPYTDSNGPFSESGTGTSQFKLSLSNTLYAEPSHTHPFNTSQASTGITLSTASTGITMQSEGIEARPRNLAFPAWLSY